MCGIFINFHLSICLSTLGLKLKYPRCGYSGFLTPYLGHGGER